MSILLIIVITGRSKLQKVDIMTLKMSFKVKLCIKEYLRYFKLNKLLLTWCQ